METIKKLFEKAIENPYMYKLYTFRFKKPQKMRLFYKTEDLN